MENKPLQWATIGLFLALSTIFTLVILVLYGAATAKTASKEGFVYQKHFAPEFTIPGMQVAIDANEEPITVVTQEQTVPASYEVEVEGGCRFSVPPNTFQKIRVGDRIRYRESQGMLYHDCEWDPR